MVERLCAAYGTRLEPDARVAELRLQPKPPAKKATPRKNNEAPSGANGTPGGGDEGGDNMTPGRENGTPVGGSEEVDNGWTPGVINGRDEQLVPAWSSTCIFYLHFSS